MHPNHHKIQVIDSHTAGEPTRLVYAGFPELPAVSVAEQLSIFKNQHDAWRKAVILEPRGNDILVGALLCTPQNPSATAGVIFFNNSGYLGMCGHGTIGLITSLAHMGHITTGRHTVETPVGDVQCELHADGSVSIDNIYSYRYRKAVAVEVAGLGTIHGDIAWGGNWFFLVKDSPHIIGLDHVETLTDISVRIMQALADAGITGEHGAPIDHIELFQDHPQAHSQNFVLCPGKAYDRSPCGTGTSAKLACLAADGALQAGEIWRQASVIGSEFSAFYRPADDGRDGIFPTIRGHAYVCAENTLLIDPNDPFQWGIFAQ